MYFALIEQHIDFARQDDGVIHALRAVHECVPRGRHAGGGRVRETHFLEEARVVELGVWVRQEVDHTQNRAAGRGCHANLAIGRVGVL